MVPPCRRLSRAPDPVVIRMYLSPPVLARDVSSGEGFASDLAALNEGQDVAGQDVIRTNGLGDG